MKGHLVNPKPVSGLSSSIIENKYLEFYVDIVNNRNLEAKEFFEYIKKYGNNYKINRKIEYLSYNISSIKANKLKLIIEYKKAELKKDNDKIKSLKNSFNKIKNVEIVNDNYEKNTNYYEIGKSEFNIDEVNEILNNYLKDGNMTEEEIYNFRHRMRSHLSLLDYRLFNDYNIKSYNIKVLTKREINEIIELINYFIKNISNNICILEDLYSNYNLFLNENHELNNKNNKMIKRTSSLSQIEDQDTKDLVNKINININQNKEKITKNNREIENIEKNIRNLYPELSKNLEEKTKDNLYRVYISKISGLNKYLKDYKFILEFFVSFKNKIETKENLCDLKINLNNINLQEEFIKDLINKIRSIINYYKSICKYNLSDKKLDDMKEDYISKVYKPNN